MQLLWTGKKPLTIDKSLFISISQIRQISPNYSISLYNKYFQVEDNYHLSLTHDEMEFLKNIKKIKAVYVNNFAP